jgi:two-component system cell cycle sensor histidine kinase/response regulator CckA
LSIVDQVHGAIDLILTDVIMPDMAGPAMVGQILEKWAGIRTVYMSGYAQNDKIRSEMADRDTSFLQKPFSADSLLLTVREVLDQPTRHGN